MARQTKAKHYNHSPTTLPPWHGRWRLTIGSKNLIKVKMKVSIKTEKKVKFSNFKVAKDL
jgi:hypothetical protein